MGNYKLVNPKIAGTFESVISAKNENEAADEFWRLLTSKVSGNIPRFLFTFENEAGDLVTYNGTETPTDNKYADYQLNKVDLKLSREQEKNLREEGAKIDKISRKIQDGGKKKHRRRYEEDDSSSDSDDDTYTNMALLRAINKPQQQPIVYWWYTPTIYPDVTTFYVPTFAAPLSPYVEISLSSAFLG